VDGESEPTTLPDDKILGWNAAAKYLGATEEKSGAAGSADLSYAYDYRWLCQSPQTWSEHLKSLGWEPEPSTRILEIFAGTARYKMRPWWSTYDYANYMPTCRAPFNPMRRVFRTVGLVRGKNSYGFVVDDLKKDDATHLYQWTAMLNGGVWRAEVSGLANNQIALAFGGSDPDVNSTDAKPAITPKPGEPLLLITALGMSDSRDATLPLLEVARLSGPPDRNGKAQFYDRLVINQRAPEANYRVLLIPFRAGEPRPEISMADGNAVVTQAGQRDEIKFVPAENQRTRVRVARGGKEILESK